MGDLLKLANLFLVTLVYQIIFSYFNFTFLFSKIKTGIYTVPFLGSFDSWWRFTIAAWAFNAPAYIVATILVVWTQKFSLNNFGIIYASMIVSQAVTILTTIFFMWYRIGELPNRNGWIAIVLILIASLFAANSGRRI